MLSSWIPCSMDTWNSSNHQLFTGLDAASCMKLFWYRLCEHRQEEHQQCKCPRMFVRVAPAPKQSKYPTCFFVLCVGKPDEECRAERR